MTTKSLFPSRDASRNLRKDLAAFGLDCLPPRRRVVQRCNSNRSWIKAYRRCDNHDDPLYLFCLQHMLLEWSVWGEVRLSIVGVTSDLDDAKSARSSEVLQLLHPLSVDCAWDNEHRRSSRDLFLPGKIYFRRFCILTTISFTIIHVKLFLVTRR